MAARAPDSTGVAAGANAGIANADTAAGRPQTATISSGTGCLPGNWILDNTSLAVAMTNSMRRGANGTNFTLDSIDGDYLADIDPAQASVRVTWKDWIMKGTAATKNGTFPMRLRLDGLQEYNLVKLTETAMHVALKRDGVNATVTFAGMTVTDPTVEIPRLSDGTWTCNVDSFTLVSDGHTWKFQRADW